MAQPIHQIRSEQVRAFRLAVCERLGIDPSIVSETDFLVETSGEMGEVSLKAFLPAAELVAMFNAAGRVEDV